MDYPTFVEHIRQDEGRVVTVAQENLSRDVSSCPGWTVRDLVRHLAEVYEHKIACTKLQALAWLVTLELASVTLSPALDGPDARLEGAPSDVLLWLWGGAPDDRVGRYGDPDAIRTLRSRLARATQ